MFKAKIQNKIRLISFILITVHTADSISGVFPIVLNQTHF